MCNIPLLLFRLTFSFASTSDEASGGSGGQTAGLGQGNMLSEALQGRYKSYSSVQENLEFFMVINRLTKVLQAENFPFAVLPTLPTISFLYKFISIRSFTE